MKSLPWKIIIRQRFFHTGEAETLMPVREMTQTPPQTFAGLQDEVYDDGHLRVEHQNYYVSCAGRSIKLPRSEFLIISRLARTPERIVASEELWQCAWGESKPFNAVSLHVYLYRLRRKLAPHGLNIETMVNVGYRLMP